MLSLAFLHIASWSPEQPPFPPPVTILLLIPRNLIRGSSLLTEGRRRLSLGLDGTSLSLMLGRSTSDAVVEEYTVLNRKGGPNSRPPKNFAVIFDAGSSGIWIGILDLRPLGNEPELLVEVTTLILIINA
ncbi:hypothetical protein YC2023_027112 [Brassica napus]